MLKENLTEQEAIKKAKHYLFWYDASKISYSVAKSLPHLTKEEQANREWKKIATIRGEGNELCIMQDNSEDLRRSKPGPTAV